MAKFNFRLNTLLKLHMATRDERRGQLAEAYKAELILQEQAQQVEEEIANAKQNARAVSSPGDVSVDLLLNSHRYELLLRAQRQMIDSQQKKISDEIERRRQRLVEADREVRVLEKLREKQRNQHEQELHLIEIKQLDEVAARQTFREEEYLQ